MKAFRVPTIVAIVMIGVAWATPIRVYACVFAPGVTVVLPTPVPPLSATEKVATARAEIPAAFLAADAVFRGEVVNVAYPAPGSTKVNMNVDTVWKGSVPVQADVVTTAEMVSDCDVLLHGPPLTYKFIQGKTYVVYARAGQSGLTPISGTKEATTPTLEESVLGPGTSLASPTLAPPTIAIPNVVPTPKDSPTAAAAKLPPHENDSRASFPVIIAGAITGVIGALIGAFVLQRRRGTR
jgi:hypothetical protein